MLIILYLFALCLGAEGFPTPLRDGCESPCSLIQPASATHVHIPATNGPALYREVKVLLLWKLLRICGGRE